MKLIKKIKYTGELELITGLHIGGTNTALNIGGPDNFVVRNPLNNIPYIPGSSLKGKLRALTEIANGEVSGEGEVTTDPDSKAGSLFGISSSEKKSKPSRIIVRDAPLWADDPEVDFSQTDLLYTESKTEVSINRITAKATLRTFERVPAGAKFLVEFIINIFEDENEEQLISTFKKAIELLENDYLGGHGSRGYGQVKFNDLNKEVINL